jgi:hypothetical protein
LPRTRRKHCFCPAGMEWAGISCSGLRSPTSTCARWAEAPPSLPQPVFPEVCLRPHP